MRTLKLFNAVLAKKSKDVDFYISEDGLIIESDAMWAKDKILKYYETERLNGNDLNKTFHKSWKKIKKSSRFELYLEQIKHYLSTYGSGFQAEVYIPDEVLNVPDVKLTYKVIKAYTKEEMIKKCLGVLQSGIALKEETIDDVLSVLMNELKYKFTGKEKIKNKEAVIKLADIYGVLPTDVMEFFRFIIYRTTSKTLLIKNYAMIEEIKKSSFNPSIHFNQFGLEKLATIFNRFKKLFMAYKNKCPETINRISKLSKTKHVPLVQNPLNNVTHTLLTKDDIHWLDNATPYALFKALSTLYVRDKYQDTFVYRIRNGKSYVKENLSKSKVLNKNRKFILDYLKENYDLTGKKFYFPEDVKFGLPTSEKMYVGNIPTGTRFYGKKMAVGIYWEDKWGARDLDLSGQNIGGKVGWNSTYNQGGGSLMHSGDITSAPNGAVEYLYANKGLREPTLVQNNVFSGKDDCEYKIIVGQGDKISRQYMMNPENRFVDIKCQSVQKQTILGMIIPKEDKQCFVLLNFGAGTLRVSGNYKNTELANKALYQQWNKPYSFNKLVKALGGEVVETPEEADYDYTLDNIEKDSFTKVFEKEDV